MKTLIFVIISAQLTFVVGCTVVNSDSLKDLGSEREPTKFFVFVGEKISVREATDSEKEKFETTREDGSINLLADRYFKAKYRVLETVRGHYESKEIEFDVFDHYGIPAFTKYKHVLLYVVKEEDGYYHSKYMYSPLFKTRAGRWAGPYPTDDYQHQYNKETKIEPEKIVFPASASIDISNRNPKEFESMYPEPYYRIEGDQAFPVYGLFVEELFLLKQSGFLKARKQFQEF